MKATRENFTKMMNGLTIDQIKELILKTWDESFGELFREIGFDIIEERTSEDESDRIYAELYRIAEAA